MKLKYKDILKQIHHELNIIFANHDISTLSNYEKRKIIFEYLCKNMQYDWNLLNQIVIARKEFQEKKRRGISEARMSFISRNEDELYNAIFNKKGICNAISKYYKFLLQEVGIYSVVIFTDDGTENKHALNLVYDSEYDTYSFDDVTGVIVNRGTIEDFFDYNISDASRLSQGNRPLWNQTTDRKNPYWLIFPSDDIYSLLGVEDKFYKNFQLENTRFLPRNLETLVESVKNIKKNKSKRGK